MNDPSGEIYRDRMGPGLAIALGISFSVLILGCIAGASWIGLWLMRLY